MSPLARLALRAYPPSFRARYGGELAALVEEMPASARTTADLFGGALRAWVRPTFNGPDGKRLRLQATVSTTWIAWCAAFLIVPALNKALLDPAGPDTVAAVRGLMDAASVLLCLGWVIALLGLCLIVARVLLPALRSQATRVLVPLIPAIILAVVVAVGFLALTLIRPEGAQHPPGLFGALTAWLLALVAFLGCLGVGPTVSLRRLDAGISTLRAPVFLGAGLAFVLTAMCGCSVIAVFLGRDAALLGSVTPVIIVALVAVIASVIALVSSANGLKAVYQK
ncbi:hypothetical protein [Arthrobacter sp. A2-55]|uniref:hypothetical protein n=1 Tax=Arthrobacter sp. A2-55 TaxID=2897337 RepID=UPI0021CDB946|nr:hypothetical protein [Arthrobacter sp. A2-55]MCU6480650.1 hypothetical protein [Arthrobacter sp. A2-55]